MNTLLEISSLTPDDIESIFNITMQYFNNRSQNNKILNGKVVVNLFLKAQHVLCLLLRLQKSH